MKIVIISDTHRKHDLVHLPEGDVLIHCGDVSGMGTEQEIREFASWFDRQEFDHKLVIAGNPPVEVEI
jgi:predicted phosphodiesterase